MACDAQSVETLLVFSDKYYSLSHRQWLEWLAQLVINAAGITVTAAINLAATRKMAALSDRNLEECRIAVFTAALFDAQSIINEIATQKYPSLDRHDLMCATIAAYCAAAGGSAQTVETLSVGNGYFKLSQRDDTLAIDAVICAANSVNCTNVTAVALSVGITGMSDRHLKEVICAVSSSTAVPCSVPTGLAASWQVDTTTIVTWDALPAKITKTEVWSSSDNITFVLSATVAAPGVTTTLSASGTAPYVKIRFCI